VRIQPNVLGDYTVVIGVFGTESVTAAVSSVVWFGGGEEGPGVLGGLGGLGHGTGCSRVYRDSGSECTGATGTETGCTSGVCVNGCTGCTGYAGYTGCTGGVGCTGCIGYTGVVYNAWDVFR
jgi:hypothetical protein